MRRLSPSSYSAIYSHIIRIFICAGRVRRHIQLSRHSARALVGGAQSRRILHTTSAIFTRNLGELPGLTGGARVHAEPDARAATRPSLSAR